MSQDSVYLAVKVNPDSVSTVMHQVLAVAGVSDVIAMDPGVIIQALDVDGSRLSTNKYLRRQGIVEPYTPPDGVVLQRVRVTIDVFEPVKEGG